LRNVDRAVDRPVFRIQLGEVVVALETNPGVEACVAQRAFALVHDLRPEGIDDVALVGRVTEDVRIRHDFGERVERHRAASDRCRRVRAVHSGKCQSHEARQEHTRGPQAAMNRREGLLHDRESSHDCHDGGNQSFMFC
jgi:hypothetical protein